MPRLPSIEDLGQRPIPQPSGGIVRYNPSTGADTVEGQALASFGQEVKKTADIFQTQINETRAKDADTAFTQAAIDMTYNPDTGYYTKLGKDAVDGYNPATTALQAKFKEIRDSLPNDEARGRYDAFAMNTMRRELISMASHAAQQNKVWQSNTADARISAYQQVAANNANNDGAFNDALNTVKLEVINKGKLLGWDNAQIQQAQMKVSSDTWKERILSKMYVDPIAANKFYQENIGQIEPQDRIVLERQLKSAVLPIEAKNAADEAIGTFDTTNKNQTKANYGDWITKAETLSDQLHPNDPIFRDMVLNQVKGKMNMIMAAQDGIAKQAHDTIMGIMIGPNKDNIFTLDDLLAQPGAKSAWAKLLPDQQRGYMSMLDTKDNRVDNNAVNDAFQRIHSPPDDPRHISNPGQLVPLFPKIRKAGYDFLRKEIDDQQTPEGQRLSETRKSFFSGIKGQFDKSTMMNIDEKGGEDFFKFQQYGQDLERKMRDQGKDPYDLYNPNSPEYLGKKIPAFHRSLEEQIQGMADTLKRSTSTTTAPTLPPEQQRKPGETFSQWKARVNP